MKDTAELLHIGQNPLFSEYAKSSWMKRSDNDNGLWSDSDIALASVGMGFTTIRPYEVNAITAAIATGVWREPYLVENPKTPKAEASLIGNGKITQNGLNLIHRGMFEAVNSKGGTANGAKLEDWGVAGKTGTVIMGRGKTARWFSGYAPSEQPKYCLTVITEGDTEESLSKKSGKFSSQSPCSNSSAIFRKTGTKQSLD